MAIVTEGKYVDEPSLQKLIQLAKNDLYNSLNGTIITRMTKTEYQSLTPKSPNTVYYVTDISTGKVECYLGDTKISGEGGGGISEIYGIPFNLSTPRDINLFDYTFENTDWNDSTGDVSGTRTNYIGTRQFIPFADYTSITVRIYNNGGTELVYFGYMYDENFNYMYDETRVYDFYGSKTGTRALPGTQKYIRIVSRYSGSSSVSPSDISSASIILPPDIDATPI